MITNVYETGNTIKLRATFRDEGGELIDPDTLPEVTIYDKNYQIIGTPFIATKEALGEYFLLYPIPLDIKQTIYFYEFKGIVGGSVAINRSKFTTRFSE